MNKIEPAYVSFEQAKLLKEKRFDLECKMCVEEGDNRALPFDCGRVMHKNSIHPYYSAPEQWQIVEWLRVNHGIWVYASPSYSRPDDNKTGKWIFEGFEPEVYFIKEVEAGEEIPTTLFLATYEHPQKAYSAAFDYILKELI
jgi:hypothetical protein